MNEHAELEQLRLHPPEPYEKMKANTEAAVVRWVYATGTYDSLLPLLPERRGFPRGTCVDRPHGSFAGDLEQFGYDAQDRLIIYRLPLSEHLWFYDTFVRYDQGVIFVWHYDHDPDRRDAAMSVEKVVMGLSGPESATKSSPNGISKEFYTWRNGRVVRIEEHSWRGTTQVYEIEHEEDGHFRLIFVTNDGRRFTVFKTDVRDLSELSDAMAHHLVAILPEFVKKHIEPNHTHMFIVYNLESDEELTCPMIALLAHEFDSDLKQAITDTVNGNTIDIDDNEFLALSEELLLTIRIVDDYEAVQAAYRRAAAELSRILAPLKVVPMDTEVSAAEDLAVCGLQ